jgi:DNA polymerase I-like protein with 3'-5' exonuclease and polymerase domains
MTSFPDLRGQGLISLDVETRDDDLKTLGAGYLRDGYIAGVAIGTEAGYREYYPVAHEGGGNLDKAKVFSWLRKQLAIPVPKVGAHLIYDLGFLEAADIKVAGPFYDVQIAEPLLDETLFTYSLESLGQRHTKGGKQDETMIDWIVEHVGCPRNKAKNFIYKAPGNVVRKYAISDIDLPLKIFAKQRKRLEALGLWDLFIMESKLIPMLLAMRQRGVRVDLGRAEELYGGYTKRCGAVLAKIKKMSGVDADIWSAKSIAQVFDKLNLPYARTEKTNAPSFRKEFLMHHPHPVAGLIREVRHLDKLKETFILNAIINGSYNARIHCNFNQLRGDSQGTVSGRFSSSQPNLQQVPVRGDDSTAIRAIFIPEEKQTWEKFDWSQIEYRLMVNDAAYFEFRGADEVINIYRSNSNADFHAIVAEMTGLDRAAAKIVNFGIAYGEGVKKLCKDLNLEMDQGKKLLNEYHRRAPFMRPLNNHWMNRAESEPFEIRTLLNRRRQFNKWGIERNGEYILLDHRVPGAERAFTYTALNARIQGSAADLMKKAMVDIWESGVIDILGAPHLTVHDELDFSAPKTKQAKVALKEVKHLMETAVQLEVPIVADHKSGINWGVCK